MCKRTILPGLSFGLLLVGAAFVPSARGDPPAVREIEKVADKKITLSGVVEVDETKLVRMTAKLKGRIDKLHVNVTGQTVKKGEPLADLYSPDLVVTVQNLLEARKSGNQDLERILRERLTLWTMDKDRVEEILKSGKPASHLTLHSPIGGHVLSKYQREGIYVEEGASLFDLADLSTVWIDAEIKDQVDVLLLNARVAARVTVEAIPKREFNGEVVGLFQDPKTRMLKVRFAVKNPRDELLPGMLATVALDLTGGAKGEPKDGKLKKLLSERLAALRVLVKLTTDDYQAGKSSLDRVFQAQRALLDAQLELCESDKERIAVLEENVALAKEYEKFAVERYQKASAVQSDVIMAQADRLAAEIALERAKAKAPAKPK